MPTSAEGSSGLNSQLYMYEVADSPATLLHIPKVRSVSPIGGSAPGTVQLTHHDITDLRHRNVPSFSNPGVVTATLNFLPNNAAHQTLLGLNGTGFERDWRVEYPTSGAITPGTPLNDDYVEFTASLSVRTEGHEIETPLDLVVELTVSSGFIWYVAGVAITPATS